MYFKINIFKKELLKASKNVLSNHLLALDTVPIFCNLILRLSLTKLRSKLYDILNLDSKNTYTTLLGSILIFL